MHGKHQTGFTLIEIAIVLAVVGVLLGATLTGIKPAVESSHRATTTSRLDRVELALLAYVMQNGCLPCPAKGSLPTTATGAGWSLSGDASGTDFYGPGYSVAAQNRPCAGTTAGGCSTDYIGSGSGNAIGVVPWNTLGISEGDITDGWHDRISYAVTSSLTVTPATSMVRTLPASYPSGTLTVNDNAATPAQQTSAAAYVLISYGADRAFAFAASSGKTISSGLSFASTDPEAINSPTTASGGTAFRQDKTSLNQSATSKYFDDIVRYRTAPNLILDCGPNACGNPGG